MKTVIALGSNCNQEENISKAQTLLKQRFKNVKFSDTQWTEPIGITSDKFLNCIYRPCTIRREDCKRDYMAVRITGKLIITLLLFLTCSVSASAQKSKDAEELGKALEYFTSAKYHEALLIFQRLDKEYKLNERFKAYIGLCYYHDWDYETAAKYLEDAMPKLEVFAPHERSVYYYTTAESKFNLKRYKEAIPYYEKTLTVCYEREKADVYYRLGLCNMFLQAWKPAYDQYMNAEKIYCQYKKDEDVQGRLAQIKRMSAACWANYEATLPKDSLSKIDDNTTNKHNETMQLKNISTILNSLISTMLLPQNTPDSVKDIIKKEEKRNLEK